MIITALTKFTALDFPDKLACIIFTGGCNLRCGFCHNAEFVLPEKLKELEASFIPFEVIVNFLKSRQGLLEGVVICGGEPTVHPDLVEKIRVIKSMGFAVKLDTNGLNPVVLENLLKENLVDYVAMDLKDDKQYSKNLVGVTVDSELIIRSINLIMNSGIDYEFRTTVLPSFHKLEVLQRMGNLIKGAKKWSLQQYRNAKTLNPAFACLSTYSKGDLNNFAESLNEYVEKIVIR